MSFEPGDPDFRQRIRDSFQKQRFMGFIDARLVEVSPAFCEIHLPYRAELSQQDGYFHAGIIATLADNAAGYAAYTLMPADSAVLTVEFKINLLAPGKGDKLISRGRVVKAGRTLTVCKSDVFNHTAEGEQLCATAQLTMMSLVHRVA